MPAFAVGIAASTLTGQYLGARNPARAGHAVWLCWAYGASASVLVGISFILFPQAYVRIITDEPVFLETAPTLLFIAGWVQIGFATYLVLSGAMRGAGDTRWTMILTFGSTFLVRLPLAWWIGLHLGYGLVGIWVVLSAELMVRGGLFLARFLHGGWTKIQV
jgi:Na+-driven multidrug efflux pump